MKCSQTHVPTIPVVIYAYCASTPQGRHEAPPALCLVRGTCCSPLHFLGLVSSSEALLATLIYFMTVALHFLCSFPVFVVLNIIRTSRSLIIWFHPNSQQTGLGCGFQLRNGNVLHMSSLTETPRWGWRRNKKWILVRWIINVVCWQDFLWACEKWRPKRQQEQCVDYFDRAGDRNVRGRKCTV